jgi:hypothetical protein
LPQFVWKRRECESRPLFTAVRTFDRVSHVFLLGRLYGGVGWLGEWRRKRFIGHWSSSISHFPFTCTPTHKVLNVLSITTVF